MIKFKSLLKTQTAILVIISIFFISSACWAAPYYVDATNGNDNNDGLSPSEAWRTIAEVNSASFQPGDQILFKRGDVWREQLTIPSFGLPGNPITIGAYGSGAPPVISGADIFSNWTSEVVGSFTAYYTLAATEAKQVFEDGSRLKGVSAKDALTAGTWWQDSTNQNIYIRTVDSDHPDGHTIETSQRDFGIGIQHKSHITVENVKVEKTNDKGLDIFASNEDMNTIIIRNVVSTYNYTAGFRSTGMNNRTINNVIIEDSVFNYNGADGVYITGGSDNFTIRRNTVHNNCLLDDPSESELNFTAGIRAIGPSVEYVIFEDNVVYANGNLNGHRVVNGARGFGIWFDTIGTGGIMRRNSVHDNMESGIYVEATRGAKVYYNISFNNSAIGIGITRQVHDNEVYNNVAYNNLSSGIRIIGDTPTRPNSVTGNLVKNNISIGNGYEFDARFGGENDGVFGYGNVYEYNCFGVESERFIMWKNERFKDTYDAFEIAYGGNTHSIESDPLFTNANNSDFTLQSGSPAIDAGVDVGLTHDFNNTAISPFGSVDVGAIEYQGAPEIIGNWRDGIWYWDVAGSKWTRMTTNNPGGDIAAGDFSGDGIADVASSWTSGLWYQDGATLIWTKVPGVAPVRLTAGDVTGDGRSEIIGTWSSGIWYWDVAKSEWTQMSASAPTGDIAAGDFTGDGIADVASSWANGLWYQDGATLDWTKISGAAPDSLTAGDMTGDGQSEIIGTWSSGIWYWDVAESEWTQMTASTPTGDIAAGDFSGDERADVASIFSSGLWYQDGDTLDWTKVSGSVPDRLTAGDVTAK